MPFYFDIFDWIWTHWQPKKRIWRVCWLLSISLYCKSPTKSHRTKGLIIQIGFFLLQLILFLGELFCMSAIMTSPLFPNGWDGFIVRAATAQPSVSLVHPIHMHTKSQSECWRVPRRSWLSTLSRLHMHRMTLFVCTKLSYGFLVMCFYLIKAFD